MNNTKATQQPEGQTGSNEVFTDDYIKSLLCKYTILKPKDLPKRLIEIKRQQLIFEQTINNKWS